MEIQRNVASWRDTTYEEICDIFSSEDEQQHIYNIIRRLIGGNTLFRKFRGFFCLVSKIFQGKHGKPLPPDLVPEIVSRLPAEDVLKCIMVCKGWVDVILTPQFFVLHESRAPPVILLQNFDWTNDMKLYSLDLTYEEPYIRRFDTTKLLPDCYRLVGTFDGLLLLRILDLHSFRLCIYNPLTGRVLAEVTVEGKHYYCGFWFHPFKREYVFLATSYLHSYGRGYCYKIFNLKGQSTVLGWYQTLPSREVPININKSLFMLQNTVGLSRNCIMIFNFETETVDFKCHPHSKHCPEGHWGDASNGDMRLLEIDGSLAFAHVCENTKSLHLWILDDRTTWLWNEKYRINLNWCSLYPINFKLNALRVQREEMLMFYRPNRLIAFNLRTRRVRNIDLNIVYDENSDITVSSTTYKSSFVGLKRMTHI